MSEQHSRLTAIVEAFQKLVGLVEEEWARRSWLGRLALPFWLVLWAFAWILLIWGIRDVEDMITR